MISRTFKTGFFSSIGTVLDEKFFKKLFLSSMDIEPKNLDILSKKFHGFSEKIHLRVQKKNSRKRFFILKTRRF